AIAISRIAPGPNGLFVLPIGYDVAGIPGALVATAALWVVAIPVLLLMRVYDRLSRSAIMSAGLQGVEAAGGGLTMAVAYTILIATTPPLFPVGVAAVAFALVAFARADALLVLAGGAAVGLLASLRGG